MPGSITESARIHRGRVTVAVCAFLLVGLMAWAGATMFWEMGAGLGVTDEEKGLLSSLHIGVYFASLLFAVTVVMPGLGWGYRLFAGLVLLLAASYAVLSFTYFAIKSKAFVGANVITYPLGWSADAAELTAVLLFATAACVIQVALLMVGTRLASKARVAVPPASDQALASNSTMMDSVALMRDTAAIDGKAAAMDGGAANDHRQPAPSGPRLLQSNQRVVTSVQDSKNPGPNSGPARMAAPTSSCTSVAGGADIQNVMAGRRHPGPPMADDENRRRRLGGDGPISQLDHARALLHELQRLHPSGATLETSEVQRLYAQLCRNHGWIPYSWVGPQCIGMHLQSLGVRKRKGKRQQDEFRPWVYMVPAKVVAWPRVKA